MWSSPGPGTTYLLPSHRWVYILGAESRSAVTGLLCCVSSGSNLPYAQCIQDPKAANLFHSPKENCSSPRSFRSTHNWPLFPFCELVTMEVVECHSIISNSLTYMYKVKRTCTCNFILSVFLRSCRGRAVTTPGRPNSVSTTRWTEASTRTRQSGATPWRNTGSK